MKNKYILITIGIIILLVALYFIYKAINKNNTIQVVQPNSTPRGVSSIAPISGITSVVPVTNTGTSSGTGRGGTAMVATRTINLLKGKNI